MELPDPSGETFNAAADFEQVMPGSIELSLLDRIDPYTDRRFSSEELGPLLDDVVRVLDHLGRDAKPPASPGRGGMRSRGLLRLKAMVEYVLVHPETLLVNGGD